MPDRAERGEAERSPAIGGRKARGLYAAPGAGVVERRAPETARVSLQPMREENIADTRAGDAGLSGRVVTGSFWMFLGTGTQNLL
jgi:hypothetical protein